MAGRRAVCCAPSAQGSGELGGRKTRVRWAVTPMCSVQRGRGQQGHAQGRWEGKRLGQKACHPTLPPRKPMHGPAPCSTCAVQRAQHGVLVGGQAGHVGVEEQLQGQGGQRVTLRCACRQPPRRRASAAEQPPGTRCSALGHIIATHLCVLQRDFGSCGGHYVLQRARRLCRQLSSAGQAVVVV